VLLIFAFAIVSGSYYTLFLGLFLCGKLSIFSKNTSFSLARKRHNDKRFATKKLVFCGRSIDRYTLY
jgi:hypothetical protein